MKRKTGNGGIGAVGGDQGRREGLAGDGGKKAVGGERGGT
jgi:hypothetical protein